MKVILLNHPLEYLNANFYLQIITESLQARYNAIKPPPPNKQKNHSTKPPAQDREATVLISFTKVLAWFAD